jgi:osmotically-inducible protein OsmY
MKHLSTKLALLSILMFAATVALAQQPQSQTLSSAPDHANAQPQEGSSLPPHVDAEPNPEDRTLEQSIQDNLGKDPHMAYSSVAVHVTDTQIMLTGTVHTSTAKDQAAKIAGEHAGGRKIENQIKVNPNTHPGL